MKKALTLMFAALSLAVYAQEAIDKIADLKFPDKTGNVENSDLADSCTEAKYITRINYPVWAKSIKFKNNDLQVPGGKTAMVMGMSHGVNFGTGDNQALMLDDGPFTVHFRLFNTGKGDIRIGKKDTFMIRIFEEKGNMLWVAQVQQDGKTYSAWGNPGKIGEWHDYFMIFNPDGRGMQTLVDGRLSGQFGVNNKPADSNENPVTIESCSSSPQYLTAINFIGHAINDKEMKALMEKP